MNVDNYESLIKSLLSSSSDGFVVANVSLTIEDLTVKREDQLSPGERFIRITDDLTYHRCVAGDRDDSLASVLSEHETLKQAVTKFLI